MKIVDVSKEDSIGQRWLTPKLVIKGKLKEKLVIKA